jgi:deoxyribonuclease IV
VATFHVVAKSVSSRASRSRRSGERAARAGVGISSLLGAHVSTAGGVDQAIGRALSIGCTAMQIFVKNNMQWFAASPFGAAELRAFHEHAGRASLGSVFGHSGYMINLAAANPEFLEKSRRALREELIRADALKLPWLVLHPGAHMGRGIEAGLRTVVESIDVVLAALPGVRTRIALETTAGQGTCLGATFEELAFVLETAREPERLCVCADTAHLFAAGYDISTADRAARVFRTFDRIIGRSRLVALHLNDSKTALGSRVDRHQHIGKGTLGLEPFRYIMNAPRFAAVPKVLETPKDKEMTEDIENLATLRSLLLRAKK